jgi:hypothetical protein
MDGIFCYCHINDFGDANEILQDDVMVYVNHIAQVRKAKKTIFLIGGDVVMVGVST